MDSTESTRNVSSAEENIYDWPLHTELFSRGQQDLRITIFVFGFVINSIILLVIIYSRQLHYPRHLFWAGVSLINHYYLIQCVVEFISRVYRSAIACKIYVFNASVGYSALLLCLSLAACDRYSAIAHYNWYKRKVTNRAVIIAMISSFFLTFVVTTSPFWTGYKSASSCTVNLTHMHWVLAWDLLLGIFSVVLHVKIYIVSRATIRQYATQLSNQLPLTQRFTNQEINPQGINNPPFINQTLRQRMRQWINIKFNTIFFM